MPLRRLFAVMTTLITITGCSNTVTGAAARAPVNDDANVSAMDTGPYPTTPGHIYGAAGDDRVMQGMLEAHRLAEFVTGPWQVDRTVHLQPPGVLGLRTGALAIPDDLAVWLGRPFTDAAAHHGFLTGFTSSRVTPSQEPVQQGMTNAVLRFPDPVAASAAAAEMAAAVPVIFGDSPHEPLRVDQNPESIATQYLRNGDVFAVESFTPHGPYVIYTNSFSSESFDFTSSRVVSLLTQQEPLLDKFVATDPGKLSSLPVDPSGHLLAATLSGEGNAVPSRAAGPWQRRGWLHFETDPYQASAWLQNADIDYVIQRGATVYQTRNPAAAELFLDRMSAQLAKTLGIQPLTSHPAGFPDARCFERITDLPPSDALPTQQWMQWHFKCVARADRYTFSVFSNTAKDAMQQASAQYRILAGK